MTERLFTVDLQRRNTAFYLILVLLFVLNFILFYLLATRIPSDLSTHAYIAQRIALGKSSYPPNFLFYFLLNILTLFNGEIKSLLLASSIVLASANVLKFVLSLSFIRFLTGETLWVAINKRVIIIALLSCQVAFAIPDFFMLFERKWLYTGMLVPNVWHNSTIIFLTPFAIWLLVKVFQFANGVRSSLWMVLLLILVNAAIKPSFLFVFIPLYGLFLMTKYGFKSGVSIFVVPMLFSVSIVGLQYFLIYFQNLGASAEDSSVIIAPFKAWSEFVPSSYYLIPHVFFSLLFPLVSLLANTKSGALRWSWGGLLFATLIFILFAETGPRAHHGNFYWQIVPCTYIVFLISLTGIIEKLGVVMSITDWRLLIRTDLRVVILTIIFFLHVTSGIAYLIKCFVVGNLL